jgi:hypothetical protein
MMGFTMRKRQPVLRCFGSKKVRVGMGGGVFLEDEVFGWLGVCGGL